MPFHVLRAGRHPLGASGVAITGKITNNVAVRSPRPPGVGNTSSLSSEMQRGQSYKNRALGLRLEPTDEETERMNAGAHNSHRRKPAKF